MLALMLMIADRQSGSFHRFRGYVAVIVTPLQYAVDVPIKIINWISNDFSTQHRLIKANAQLHAQVFLLRAQLQRQTAIESENKELTGLLQSSLKAQEKTSVAQILAVSVDPYMHQIVIDKGQKNKVFVGQPVLDADGVMGQIVQTGLFTSRVMLITDSQSAIPVQVKRNGIRAIAVGESDHDLLKLVHVINTADVKLGDILVTSGLAQRYPFGYPVAQVIKVDHDAGTQFATILAKPLAQLNRSRLVLLVWPQKTTIDPAISKILKISSTQPTAKKHFQVKGNKT